MCIHHCLLSAPNETALCPGKVFESSLLRFISTRCTLCLKNFKGWSDKLLEAGYLALHLLQLVANITTAKSKKLLVSIDNSRWRSLREEGLKDREL